MKRILFLITVFFMFTSFSFSQKYAYVDTEYILDNIPSYKDAQAQLDDQAVTWQKEIEEKFAEIDKLYKAFQAEAVLLPDDVKKQKEDEIIKKEKEAKDLQKKRFGKDGDLFKKRQELVKPIQDEIYKAIEDVATLKGYAFVFDKAGSLSILYANNRFDISDDVLKKIQNVGSFGNQVKEKIKENVKPNVKIGDETIIGGEDDKENKKENQEDSDKPTIIDDAQ